MSPLLKMDAAAREHQGGGFLIFIFFSSFLVFYKIPFLTGCYLDNYLCM